MRVQAEAKGVAVLAEVPDALAPPRANPEKLQRVLFNLIQNAIRHTPADGSVVVRAEPVADRIEVEVATPARGSPPRSASRCSPRSTAAAGRRAAGAGAGWGSRCPRDRRGARRRIWLADARRGNPRAVQFARRVVAAELGTAPPVFVMRIAKVRS